MHVPDWPAVFVHDGALLVVQHWILSGPGQRSAGSDAPPIAPQAPVSMQLPD